MEILLSSQQHKQALVAQKKQATKLQFNAAFWDL
jgi:hypothetical protein